MEHASGFVHRLRHTTRSEDHCHNRPWDCNPLPQVSDRVNLPRRWKAKSNCPSFYNFVLNLAQVLSLVTRRVKDACRSPNLQAVKELYATREHGARH